MQNDVFESLPPSDRRLIRNMAVDAGSDPFAITVEIVRSYLGLVRAAPDALPKTPLHKLTSAQIRKGGRGNG